MGWLAVSFVIVVAVIFIAFVVPAFVGSPSKTKEISLTDFCGAYNMQARQRIFNPSVCYQVKKVGAQVTETDCEVIKANSTWKFKDACIVDGSINSTRK